jgi:hypothetical protein
VDKLAILSEMGQCTIDFHYNLEQRLGQTNLANSLLVPYDYPETPYSQEGSQPCA